MMSRLFRLAADSRGNSVVELALVAPVLVTFLVGMVDISRAVAERLHLEQASQRTIEKVMNGQASDFTTLNAEAAAAAGAPVVANDVTVTFWLECNGTSMMQSRATMVADFNQSCPSGQSYARYLTIEVEKDFRPTFSTRFFPGANSDGTFTITGEAGLRVQQ